MKNNNTITKFPEIIFSGILLLAILFTIKLVSINSYATCGCPGGKHCTVCSTADEPDVCVGWCEPKNTPVPTREPTKRPDPTKAPTDKPGDTPRPTEPDKCKDETGCKCGDKVASCPSGGTYWKCKSCNNGPTDTPGGPTRPPDPPPGGTCTVQGFKILENPAAGIQTDLDGLAVRDSGNNVLSITNPYFIGVPEGDTDIHVDVPFGYNVYTTACTNEVTCHGINIDNPARALGAYRTLTCPAGGNVYIDLWFQFVKTIPCPTPRSAVCVFDNATGKSYINTSWDYTTGAYKYILRLDNEPESWYNKNALGGDFRSGDILDVTSFGYPNTYTAEIMSDSNYNWNIQPGYEYQPDGDGGYSGQPWCGMGSFNCPKPTPFINIKVVNPENGPVKVNKIASTYKCFLPICTSFSVDDESSLTALAKGIYEGGAGIILNPEQILQSATSTTTGAVLKLVNDASGTWQNFWWPSYPTWGSRDVTYVVVTNTPTPTPIHVPEVIVTGAIQQQTGGVTRDASPGFSLPILQSIGANNDTVWTGSGGECATAGTNILTDTNDTYGHIAKYTFQEHNAINGYCVPGYVNGPNYSMDVILSPLLKSPPPLNYSLMPGQYKVTLVNTTNANLPMPFKYTGTAWIKLLDTSFTRVTTTKLVNHMPFILDKYYGGTSTQANVGTGDSDDPSTSLGMIGETHDGIAGFVPNSANLDIDPLGKVQFGSGANQWILPAGYSLDSVKLVSSLKKFAEYSSNSKAVNSIHSSPGNNVELKKSAVNILEPNSLVGSISVEDSSNAILLVIDASGQLGNITIKDSSIGTGKVLLIAKNINIHNVVSVINGILVASEKIDMGNGGIPLKIKGNVVTGGGIINSRSRSDDDHARPSVLVTFDIDTYINLLNLINTNKINK
ncbi:MAG: hypothetical protein U0525_05770 [Patescibacteria group bacterium]